MKKYNISRYLPKNSTTVDTAEFQLKIELTIDGDYLCKYVSMPPDNSYVFFEGIGETLEQAFMELSKKIN